MGGDLPKQFRFLATRRVAEYTVAAFRRFALEARIWLVIAREYQDLAVELWGHIPEIRIITGGKERFDSVKAAVRQIQPQGLVFVHDLVRPCVSQGLLERCYRAAKEHGSAVPALAATETVRYADKLIPRADVRLIQTPQVFRAEWLKQAFQQDFRPEFSDEAAVVEQAGYPLHFVQGERYNLKITYPEDLPVAEYLCSNFQEFA